MSGAPEGVLELDLNRPIQGVLSMATHIITITNGGFAAEVTDVNRNDTIIFRLDPGDPNRSDLGPGRVNPADVTWPSNLFSSTTSNPLPNPFPVTTESTRTVTVSGEAPWGRNQISADRGVINGWIKVGS